MKENEFRIFIPEKKFLWTANKVIFSVLASLATIAIIFYEFEEHHPIGNIALELAMFIVMASFIVVIINFNRKKTLNGTLDGMLKLEHDRIIVGQEEVKLEELNSIDFHANDYIGLRDTHSYIYYNPHISNGVNNFCVLKLKGGAEKKIWFQQEDKGELTKNRDLLIGYHLKGKMSFLRLFRILGISKTKEVKAFKESLKKL